MAKPKNLIYIVGVVTDDPSAWEMVAKKDSESLQFSLGIQTAKLDKVDVKFINENIKSFLHRVIASQVKDGTVGKA